MPSAKSSEGSSSEFISPWRCLSLALLLTMPPAEMAVTHVSPIGFWLTV